MSILTEAANILDTSEFKVLECAYLHWFGKSAPIDLINRAFSDYLHTHATPYWARHYAHGIISRFESEHNAQSKFIYHFWLLFLRGKQQTTDHNPSLAA